eukprot:TRINITY_DN13181_c0_g2_i1.p1 TRINITY_DN13181_c0_g2~~TRINITY_DN13181_c0_g2_i1.p1  ORF type:complete len:302 (+),score=82.20 TRINITY_DN13181_c0_g2_i1:87-908(+)
MDDDAPLSALASAKPKVDKKITADDDTPLASLAAGGKGKGAKKGAPAAKPGVPAQKAKGKGKAGKRKRSSSSSSSSSGSSSSSSSGPRGGKKPAKPKLKKQKTKDADEEPENNAVKRKERSAKEQAVSELLCRWWYVLPDWPPPSPTNYEEELRAKGYRRVRIQEWEWVPEEDSQHCKKAYELSQFKGLFRTASGELLDLRPKDSCPCFSNFMKKELHQVYDLLVKALENQVTELVNGKYHDKALEGELRSKIMKVKEKAFSAKQLSNANKKR